MTKAKKLSVEEVKHVANLANLPLSDDESTKFQQQLSQTVSYINELNEVNTGKIPPTSQVTGKTNEFRDDEVVPGLSQEQALKNGRKTHNGFFVSKIIWD